MSSLFWIGKGTAEGTMYMWDGKFMLQEKTFMKNNLCQYKPHLEQARYDLRSARLSPVLLKKNEM